MTAQDTTGAVHATTVDLTASLDNLSLQQSDGDCQPCSNKVQAKRAVSLTATTGLHEPPAPTACISPRLYSKSLKSDSRAAFSVQCDRSPFAQRIVKTRPCSAKEKCRCCSQHC